MVITEFIDDLKQKGIELSFVGGKLKYSGPEEEITPALIESLKENKGKLIKYIWPEDLNILLPINPQGSKVPLFVIHGDNGNYIISDYLGQDQPVYGFFHPGSEGERIIYKSVEHMASVYLEKILKVWPDGPFYLIGYSFGGVLAFEIAVQLQKLGKQIPFLGMIDSISPRVRVPKNWKGNPFTAIRLNILRPIRRGLKHKIKRLKCEPYLLLKKPLPFEFRSDYLMYHYNYLRRRYRPGRFKGKLLLFRATETSSAFRYLGWESLVDEINLIEMDGKHLEIFIGEERNETLRQEIKKHLMEVEQ
jgi:thioesterase domain-containing protein